MVGAGNNRDFGSQRRLQGMGIYSHIFVFVLQRVVRWGDASEGLAFKDWKLFVKSKGEENCVSWHWILFDACIL